MQRNRSICKRITGKRRGDNIAYMQKKSAADKLEISRVLKLE